MDRFGRIGSDLAKYSGLQMAGQQVAGAAKSWGFIIAILGILHYIIKIYFPSLAVYSIIFSLSLFVMAGYAIAQRTDKDKVAVLIPMLVFCIWYFVFSGDTSLTFLLWFIPVLIAIFILPMVLTKGASALPEILGLLPVLFLFLDVGLLPWLVEVFDIIPTILLENLMLYMPWWAFFGIMTLPTDASSKGSTNFLINLTRVVGIIFIIATFIIPTVPNVGYETSLTAELPGLGELSTASEKYQKRAAKTQHPFFTNMVCILEGRYDNIPACVKDKNLEKEFEYYCRFEEDHKKGTTKFKTCVAQQKKKREKELLVAGQNDRDIKEPTEVKFRASEFFPEKQYFTNPADTLNYRYPIDFTLSNPREQDIDIIFTCNFKPKLKSKTEIPGEIDLGKDKKQTLKATGTETKLTIACKPTKELKGKYELTFTAVLQNIVTGSRLKRAFIGDKDLIWKEEWIPKIKKSSFSRREHLSRGPDEFVRLNFAFGNFLEDPIIEFRQEQNNFIILSSTIENLGKGKIVRIHDFQIDVPGFQPQATQSNCLSGNNIQVPKTRQTTIPLPTCIIETIPLELQNPDEFIVREFSAKIKYDYQKEITKSIEVKEIKIDTEEAIT